MLCQAPDIRIDGKCRGNLFRYKWGHYVLIPILKGFKKVLTAILSYVIHNSLVKIAVKIQYNKKDNWFLYSSINDKLIRGPTYTL